MHRDAQQGERTVIEKEVKPRERHIGQQGIGRQQMNCQHETEGGPAGALWHRARLLAFAGVAQAGGAPGGGDAGECCAGHSDRIRIGHQIIAIRIRIKQELGCGGVLG